MKIEYDSEVDGAYIWLVDLKQYESRFETEVWPDGLNDEIGFLLDNSGKILGIEVLCASKYLDPDLLVDQY